MTALLKFQAVLLARVIGNRYGALVVTVLALCCWMSSTTSRRVWDLLVMVGIVGLLPMTALGMVRSLDALGAVRWANPVRGVHVLAAHLLFWVAVWSVPLAWVPLLFATDEPLRVRVFVNLLLVASVAAAVAPVLQRIERRTGAWGVVFVGPMIVVAPMFALIVATADEGRFATAPLGTALLISLVAGAWCFLREEVVPTDSATVPEVETRSRLADALGRAMPPTWSLLRSTWPPVWASVHLAMGLGFQFVSGPLQLLWIPFMAIGLGNVALASWPWPMSTPIHRGRAFRVRYLPVLLAVACAATVRCLVYDREHWLFAEETRTSGYLVVADAVAVVLFSMGLLRVQLLGGPIGRWLPSVLWVAFCFAAVSRVADPYSLIGSWSEIAVQTLHEVVQQSSISVRPVLVASAVAVGVALWRDSERAFRRLDVTELPSTLSAWGLRKSSG